MRTQDEFRAEIFRRRDQYLLKQKKMRKIFVNSCLMMCCVFLILPVLYRKPVKMSTTESVPYNTASVAVTVMPDGITESYSDSRKINAVISCLNDLTLYDINDYNENESENVRYIITVTEENGGRHTYTYMKSRYLRIDGGEWKQIGSDDAKKLDALIIKEG